MKTKERDIRLNDRISVFKTGSSRKYPWMVEFDLHGIEILKEVKVQIIEYMRSFPHSYSEGSRQHPPVYFHHYYPDFKTAKTVAEGVLKIYEAAEKFPDRRGDYSRFDASLIECHYKPWELKLKQEREARGETEPPTATFRGFLQWYRGEDTPMGDLAHDTLGRNPAWRGRTVESFREHIGRWNPSPEALETAKGAIATYEKLRG